MMESATISVLSVILALFGSVFAAFKYVNSQLIAVRRECDSKVEKLADLEAKTRHALANNTQAATGELRRDLEVLKREAVRREEITALEARLVARSDKIEVKLDHLAERLSLLASLDPQVKGVAERLDRLLARADTRVA